MQRTTIERRQVLRLLGAGIVLGGVTGTVSAGEGKYIVGTSSRAATRAARAEARSVYRVLDFGAIGQAVAGTFSQEALQSLARRADVRYVEVDGFMYAIDAASDLDATDVEVSWGVDRVDAEKVHGAHTGAGADLAIIDTGIDNDHPDLQANLGEGISFTVGGPFSSRTSTDPSEWDDGNGHGTHCAGIAAAIDNGTGVVGVAPGATLHAVKVLDNSGRGTWSDVADGIRYTADKGWHAGSMSLGGGFSQTVEDACQYAYGAGVLLVAASGNDGPGTADDHYPSASTAVIAVGATELVTDDAGTKHDSLAYFSSTGETLELAAPGRAIYSTYKGGGYDTLSGTSMACPHVSGAGALLMGASYTNTEARSQLGSTAEWPVYDYEAGRDMTAREIGNGLLDVEAVMGDSSGGGDTTAPSAPTNLTSTGKTDTSVDLSWDGSTDDGTGVDHYDVYVDGVSSLEVSGTTATVTGLAAETSYDFFVTATDGAGNESSASNTVTVTTEANSSGGTAPVIDSFDVVSGSPNNPHADVEMSWQISGSPDTVTLELYEGGDTSGSLIQTWSVSASGSQSYQEKFTSKTYTARLVASNAAGSVEATRTVTA